MPGTPLPKTASLRKNIGKEVRMQLIYDPSKSGLRMTIVCFISGSGTNYREIVARNPEHDYLVFTNRPGCGGTVIAKENRHEVIELSHTLFLKEARRKYGAGKVPRNCPERVQYEQEVSSLIENKLGKQPDLICLAGFDQWNTDWMIDRYYPRMINVHPGDTTKNYEGLHWMPSAKAIIAGDKSLRSTLFIADKSEDQGPVLVQSHPLDIIATLSELEANGEKGLISGFNRIAGFVTTQNIKTYDDFRQKANADLQIIMGHICSLLQDMLKVKGDWEIYPFAIHDLIATGRAAIEERTVFVDGNKMPVWGYRLGEHP
jgi:folate-dependent phosphoribosylglycinamide formyltransferase PurN